MGGTLALDLAGTVGWAVGNDTDKLPKFGAWALPRVGGEGARFAAFADRLYPCLKRYEPTYIVAESPLPPDAIGMTTKVAFQQYGLRAFVYEAGWRSSCAVSEISAQMVRLEVLGRAYFPNKTTKSEVVRYCRDLGLDVPNHDAADACLVWLWHQRRLRGVPPAAGPLFRTRAEEMADMRTY